MFSAFFVGLFIGLLFVYATPRQSNVQPGVSNTKRNTQTTSKVVILPRSRAKINLSELPQPFAANRPNRRIG